MDRTPQLFGQWLKQQRKSRDLTQEDLADRLSCSVETVRKVELGLRRPSRQMAELLVQVFAPTEEDREALVQFARIGFRPAPAGPPESEAGSATPTLPVPGAQTAAASLKSPGSHLPVPLTPMIGRESDLAAVESYLLGEDTRLVTLTGPPGIGKTRLALRAARDVAGRFPGGTYFVALAPIVEPEGVLPAIAEVLGVKETAAESLTDSLVRALHDRQTLIVLDNFEQVVTAAPLLGTLLASSPGLKAITTSRESLRIHGEQLYPVPPLGVPDPRHIPSLEELSACPSIALFVRSAQATVPGFALTEENARAVAGICARLDGLPLAIELAAARVKLFSPHEIEERLAGAAEGPGLQILSGGPRDLPARQRALATAIAWSYNLLSPPEQRLLRRLSVFVGGGTLSSIGAVCDARGDLEVDVVEGVESLLDKSLLRQETLDRSRLASGGRMAQPRFGMFDTIRQFALERLAESGESDAVRGYHAEFYLALLEAAEMEVWAGQQSAWYERLETEHDNLRMALEWCLSRAEQALAGGSPGREEGARCAEIALRMVGVLYLFWQVRGHLTEGRSWVKRALAVAGERQSPALAKALHGAGWLAIFQGDDAGARGACEASVAMWREIGDAWGTALALNGLGRLAEFAGDYAQARSLYQESLSLREKLGSSWGIAGSLNNLGRVALRLGQNEEAEAYMERSLALFRQTGDLGSAAILLNNLGTSALSRGDLDRAARFIRESLALERQVDYKWGIPFCLTALAEIASGQGQIERAARLLGATDALMGATGAIMDPSDRAGNERTLERVRTSLDEAAFARAWAEGRAMGFDRSVDYALASNED